MHNYHSIKGICNGKVQQCTIEYTEVRFHVEPNKSIHLMLKVDHYPLFPSCATNDDTIVSSTISTILIMILYLLNSQPDIILQL